MQMSEFMRKLLLVGAGGAAGSMCRFAIVELMLLLPHGHKFPLGTLVVNLAGCFAMGVLYSLGEMRQVFTPETRSMVLAGILGGFTTFSAFANDTWHLSKEGRNDLAFLNVGLQVILGLAACWAGHCLARACWAR